MRSVYGRLAVIFGVAALMSGCSTISTRITEGEYGPLERARLEKVEQWDNCKNQPAEVTLKELERKRLLKPCQEAQRNGDEVQPQCKALFEAEHTPSNVVKAGGALAIGAVEGALAATQASLFTPQGAVGPTEIIATAGIGLLLGPILLENPNLAGCFDWTKVEWVTDSGNQKSKVFRTIMGDPNKYTNNDRLYVFTVLDTGYPFDRLKQGDRVLVGHFRDIEKAKIADKSYKYHEIFFKNEEFEEFMVRRDRWYASNGLAPISTWRSTDPR